MNIYQIDTQINNLLLSLDESGEFSEESLKEYEALQLNRQEKIKNTILFHKHLSNEMMIINAEIERLKNLRVFVEKKQESIEKLITLGMGQDKEMDFGTCSAKFKLNPPSVIVDNEEAIPQEYKKQTITVSIDKVALKSALKVGEVTGVHLEQKTRLSIS